MWIPSNARLARPGGFPRPIFAHPVIYLHVLQGYDASDEKLVPSGLGGQYKRGNLMLFLPAFKQEHESRRYRSASQECAYGADRLLPDIIADEKDSLLFKYLGIGVLVFRTGGAVRQYGDLRGTSTGEGGGHLFRQEYPLALDGKKDIELPVLLVEEEEDALDDLHHLPTDDSKRLLVEAADVKKARRRLAFPQQGGIRAKRPAPDKRPKNFCSMVTVHLFLSPANAVFRMITSEGHTTSFQNKIK